MHEQKVNLLFFVCSLSYLTSGGLGEYHFKVKFNILQNSTFKCNPTSADALFFPFSYKVGKHSATQLHPQPGLAEFDCTKYRGVDGLFHSQEAVLAKIGFL